MALKRYGLFSQTANKIIREKRVNRPLHGVNTISNNTTKIDKTEIEDTIRKHTEISRDHLTPELKLHLLTPNCPLYHSPFSENELMPNVFKDPFWSIYWPGGQVLTRFILDHGKKVLNVESDSRRKNYRKGARILDLGAGCGASAIAAKLMGAHTVVANDIDAAACIAVEMNAGINNVEIETSNENLISQPYDRMFDVILIGDLLYDEEIAEILIPWLEQAIKHGSRIFLGDPGRHGLTKDLKKRLCMIENYSLPENVKRENYGFDTGTVWQFFK